MSLSEVKKERRIHYVLNKISNILTIVILTIAVVMVSLRLFGLNIFTVMSGSMEPSYPVGALIYTKSVDPTTLKKGDVITFMNDETTIVTHRISEVVTETSPSGEETLKFRTKGDANKSADGRLVHYKNVIGTPIITIPFLGYLAYYLQRPPGVYIALIVSTFLISMIIIPSVMNRKRKEPATEETK